MIKLTNKLRTPYPKDHSELIERLRDGRWSATTYGKDTLLGEAADALEAATAKAKP